MSQTKPFPLPTLGVDMLSKETSLLPGTVRSAINVNIDRKGNFARREGYVLQQPLPGAHSAYYFAPRLWMLVAQGPNLLRVDPTTFATIETLCTLNSPDPIEYSEYNGNLYISNKTSLFWVPSDSTTARVVGVPTPSGPTLSVSAEGGLTPGKYGVVCTFVDDRGEESGTTEVQIIDLPDGGGIRLANLPIRSGWFILIYATPPDGDVLRLVTELPAAFSTYVVAEPSQGSEVSTQFHTPLPPGDTVRWHNGRLLTAKDGALRFSAAMRPHLYNPAHNVIPFVGFISFVESVSDGIYVGDSRGVWYLAGEDPSKFELKRVSSCRAVIRSSIMVPPEHFPKEKVPDDAPVAVWLSTSGYVVGMRGGRTVELQPDRVRVAGGQTGRSVFLLHNGRKQVVTLVDSTPTAAFGTATDTVLPQEG